MSRCTNCGKSTPNGRRTCSDRCLAARRAVGIRKHGGVEPRKLLVTTHKYKVASKRNKFAMEIGLR